VAGLTSALFDQLFLSEVLSDLVHASAHNAVYFRHFCGGFSEFFFQAFDCFFEYFQVKVLRSEPSLVDPVHLLTVHLLAHVLSHQPRHLRLARSFVLGELKLDADCLAELGVDDVASFLEDRIEVGKRKVTVVLFDFCILFGVGEAVLLHALEICGRLFEAVHVVVGNLSPAELVANFVFREQFGGALDVFNSEHFFLFENVLRVGALFAFVV